MTKKKIVSNEPGLNGDKIVYYLDVYQSGNNVTLLCQGQKVSEQTGTFVFFFDTSTIPKMNYNETTLNLFLQTRFMLFCKPDVIYTAYDRRFDSEMFGFGSKEVQHQRIADFPTEIKAKFQKAVSILHRRS